MQAAAFEDHPEQRPVDRVAALQGGRLPVEDLGQDLGQDVVEADPVRQLDQGKAAPIRLGQRFGRISSR